MKLKARELEERSRFVTMLQQEEAFILSQNKKVLDRYGFAVEFKDRQGRVTR